MSRLDDAIIYAAASHTGQTRKYTGEPYVCHCIEVMQIVRQYGGTEDMQIAALLHDTIEDCGVAWVQIARAFGNDVADMVSALTDDEEGNRATRKRLSCERLGAARAEVQTIKCADLISNTASIAQHDPDFARVYLREKAALLRAMDKADPAIWKRAAELIPDEYWEESQHAYS